jgi:hypothetical protein
MFREIVTENFLAALASELKTTLNTTQGDAVRLIAEFSDREGCTDPRQVSYMLATAYHEARFSPIREIRAKPGTAVRAMQDKYWASGYYGRGLCQLTWDYNYRKFGQLLGLPLLENPDMVLDVRISAEILVIGMLRGLFSGKKLPDYFRQPPSLPDWINARKTVNGTFQADKVAGAAIRILPILVYDLKAFRLS